MKIKNMILNAPDFLLIVSTGDVKADMRSLYDLSLSCGGLSADKKEPAIDMIRRAGEFCFEVEKYTAEIAESFYEDCGLSEGATGSAKMGDIKHLSKDEALALWNITYAQLHVDCLKKSAHQALISYSVKRFPNEHTQEGETI